MKRLDDTTAAGIFCAVWELFFFAAVIADTPKGWYLFLADSIVQSVILYYDYRVEQLEKSNKKIRRLFVEQSVNYVDYVRTHEQHEKANEMGAEIISLDKYLDKERKDA